MFSDIDTYIQGVGARIFALPCHAATTFFTLRMSGTRLCQADIDPHRARLHAQCSPHEDCNTELSTSTVNSTLPHTQWIVNLEYYIQNSELRITPKRLSPRLYGLLFRSTIGDWISIV